MMAQTALFVHSAHPRARRTEIYDDDNDATTNVGFVPTHSMELLHDVAHQRREPPFSHRRILGRKVFLIFSITAASERRGGYLVFLGRGTAFASPTEAATKLFDEDDGENQTCGPETVPVLRQKTP